MSDTKEQSAPSTSTTAAAAGSSASTSAPAPAPASAAASSSKAASPDKTASASTPTPAAPAKSEEKKDAAKAEPEKKEEASAEPEEDVIDMETFQQIMDMDEEDEDEDEEDKHAFSRGIVWGYFEQAEATFTEMEEAIAEEDLAKLSSLGHFLKGSSAALGIIKVQASCEKMQHYGVKRDEESGFDLSDTEALGRIKDLLTACKKDYEVAKKWMENLYENDM